MIGRGARRRTVRLVGTLVVLGAVALGAAGCSGGQPEQPPPPDAGPSTIDLSGWKLSIPVPTSGGTPTLLQQAYTVAPWMVPYPAGGLVFWAPSSGVTTKNSDHPRTELDSRTNFKAGQGARTLRASVTLLQVPADGQGIILGQIHGADDISAVPYVMLRYQQGRVRVVVKQQQSGYDLINYPLLDDLPLNARFDFTISDLGNGTMTFSATRDGQVHRVSAPVPAAFSGATVRYQAGAYQQANTSAGDQDGGRVVFHELVESPIAPAPP